MPNRLARESSPYLRQHADNPVDWYPWGDEALARARAEDRPILLSIGYAACHWCHVMAHESFEDPTTAAHMNRDFVCIKVDREERPDLDSVYMGAVQAMVGQGGWPLTVFLTPDGRPFFGGTYFPPRAQRGMPSFRQVLDAMAAAWRERRDDVISDAAMVTSHLRSAATPASTERSAELSRADALDRAAAALVASADPKNGGFGRAPKFPTAMSLAFLLAHDAIHGDSTARDVVLNALRHMAAGGINDQIGGGFHRYSVDERWLVPHFEKMLYDQAMLASLYVDGFLVSGEAALRSVAVETLDFVRRELTSPDGAFYSSLDADSEGGEGRFYTWTPAEVAAALDPADAAYALDALMVTEAGHIEGRSVPHLSPAVDRDAARLRAVRARLFRARERRPRPGLDDKVIVSWNGLMIRAFARAGAALDRPDYVETARRCAVQILSAARAAGGLPHVVRAPSSGPQPSVGAFLGDYAALAAGILALHAATLEPDWLDEARALVDSAIPLFVDARTGAAYDTARGGEALVVRPRSPEDSPSPSGGALLAEVLFRLSALLGESAYTDLANRIVAVDLAEAVRFPLGFGQLLLSAELLAAGPIEIAVVGDPQATRTRRLVAVAQRTFAPRLVLAAGDESDVAAGRIALLANRRLEGGQATAWVCRERRCLPPITDPAALTRALGREAA